MLLNGMYIILKTITTVYIYIYYVLQELPKAQLCKSSNNMIVYKLLMDARIRFYESAQAKLTYCGYFDERFNDTYVGFMKRHSDYHVTVPAPN